LGVAKCAGVIHRKISCWGEVTEYLAEVNIIPVGPTEDGIRVYLGMRLSRDTEPNAMDNDLRRDVTIAVNKKRRGRLR